MTRDQTQAPCIRSSESEPPENPKIIRDKERVRNYHKTMEYKDQLEAKDPNCNMGSWHRKGTPVVQVIKFK